MKNAIRLMVVAMALQLAGCATIIEWIEEHRKPKPLPEDIQPEWKRAAWDRTDVAPWPVTIALSQATLHYVGGHDPWEVRVSYDHLQTLPAWFQDPDPNGLNKHNVNGTIFLIREYPAGSGVTYFASIDYLRVGQMSKRFALAPQYLIEYSEGADIGVLVSTTARQWPGTRCDGDPESPYRQRSNVTWTKWPALKASAVSVSTEPEDARGPGLWMAE